MQAVAPIKKPLSDDTVRLKKAIQLAGGNITRAAQTLGITKPYCFDLVKKANLNQWAKDIRKKNGQPPTGHPRAS